MNKEDILKQVEELTNSEDILSTQKTANEIIKSFYQIKNKEDAERKEKEADLDTDVEYDSTQVEMNSKIEEAISTYKSKVKEVKQKIQQEEKENLNAKKGIIQEFKDLVQNEENIGKLFNHVKSIRERWNEIGNIPRDVYQNIQNEFARLNEEFNYNVNIYKELQENDLKKNYSIKNQLIHQVKELLNEDKIKVIESKLKTIQNEWTSVGPTFNDHWEELKKTYWDTVHELYAKIQSHYDGLKEKQAENLKAKEGLIGQAQAILDSIKEIDTHKEWEKATESLKEINETWRKTGRVAKEYNDKIWKSFRSILDEFYSQKSEYYKEQNDNFNEKAVKKEALIKEAEEISKSNDWKETTQKLKQLQKQWTKIGHAGKFQEQKLWKKFRKQFDDFFAKKDAYYAELDKANETNLAEKEALIKEIDSYTPSEDKEKAIAELKDFSKRFNAIGNVPFKEKDRIYKAYKAAIDKHYEALSISEKEISKIQFEAKVQQLKEAGEDISEVLKQERIKIRKKIGDINAEIAKIENNFGFFNISKGAEKLMEGFKKDIDKKKAMIESLKNELKQLKD